jgi:ATP-binding cassette subfamily B protein
MLTWPVASLGWVTSIIQRASASQERINHFLHQKPDDTSGETIEEFANTINFDNVSFSFDEKEVLHQLNFSIQKGQTVGIIGSTGSGKSTLASLLVGTYRPTAGSILIDGKNLTDIKLHDYRNLIGYVPQDIFLFSESIEDNIRFGTTQETDIEDIIGAAQAADVWDDINEFNKGLQTELGERGITLSGGQKQRVALARAFVRNPDILILDDSLSAVDTGTERKIKDNLKSISKDRTTILISHRVSTVEDADFILVLDDGKIIEQGSPKELLSRPSTYSDMVKAQSAVNQKV